MVDDTERRVVWAEGAKTSFKCAIERIKEDSPINAEKVRLGILEMTRGIPQYPHRYPRDRFKIGNTGNFRAFEKYSYRVSYEISDKEIHIIRFRHVRQEPIEY